MLPWQDVVVPAGATSGSALMPTPPRTYTAFAAVIPQTAPALGKQFTIAAVHADPARVWTAESSAREVSVSRATLVRRFDAVLGETPATYVTRWRMDLASRRLRDSDQSLGEIARSVGYTSVPAFNRAFARVRGLPRAATGGRRHRSDCRGGDVH